MFKGLILAILGSCSALILCGIGSIFGVFLPICKGLISIDKNPGIFGKIFVLETIPLTESFYAFAVAMMILFKSGFFSGNSVVLSFESGIKLLIVGLNVGILGGLSAIIQGKISEKAIETVTNDEENYGKALISSFVIETFSFISVSFALILIMVA